MRYAVPLALFVAAAACTGEPAEPGRVDPAGPEVQAGPGADAAASCGEPGTLPGGARRDEAAGSLVVPCDGEDGELAITPYADGIVRIRRGKDDRGSLVPVDRPELTALRTGRRGAEAIVCGDAVEIAVEPGTCRVHARDLFDDERAFRDGEKRVVTRASVDGERFYGLGLHTRGKGGARGLDLRGSVVELFNTDAYDDGAGGFRPDAPSLYESIPFYVAVRGGAAYGVFTDNTHRTRFDLASSDPGRVRVEAAGGAIDEWIFAGPRVRDVVRRYTRVTGRTPLPARWALGFHQSRWEGPCDGAPSERPFCGADQIVGVAQRFRDEGIPADGLFLDIQHMREYRSFTFDPVRFADPSALVSALSAKGFVTHVIVDPGIKIDPGWDVYDEGMKGGHFLAFDGEVWPGPARFPDFSAPKTRAWWSALVQKSAALGVRGMWIDMNEPSSFATKTVPDDVAANGDGRATTMREVHNAYAWLEAKATYEGLAAARPAERPFVLSRAAFAGQQRWSAVWTGDAPSTWTTLDGTLPQLLHLGLSGMAFAGSDAGGYSGRAESTADLFTRWMALGSVSPFFRAHAEKNARRQEPWAFDAATRDAVRELIRERYALLPYLYSTFDEAARSGAPVLRPLFFDHDADPRTFDVADEAMLGPSILVAPIAEPAAKKRVVYLPALAGGALWYELRSGAAYEGGRAYELSALDRALPAGALPMFVRGGSIVPRIDPPSSIGAMETGGTLYLDVYPGTEKSTSSLYEDDGAAKPAYARTTFVLEPTATGARLTASTEGAFVAKHAKTVVRIVPFDRVVELSGPLPPAIDLAFDPTAEPSADVTMPIRVHLPPDTPPSTAIHVATSRSGWTHAPLARSGDEATGTIAAPRGGWLFFKVTRGDWTTVEKTAACAEIDDRHALGAARPIEVTVAAWADRCP